jgi:hypothetical protein
MTKADDPDKAIVTKAVEGAGLQFYDDLIAAVHDGRWQMDLVSRTAKEALSRVDLDVRVRQRLSNDLLKFQAYFTEVLNNKKMRKEEKKGILQIVESVLGIGYAACSGASNAKINELHARIDKQDPAEARKAKKLKSAKANERKLEILKEELPRMSRTPKGRFRMKPFLEIYSKRLKEENLDVPDASTLRLWIKQPPENKF